MTLLLNILCAAGVVLLIILAVILILILLMLFLPVTYKIKITIKNRFTASGSVRILFSALLLSFNSNGAEIRWKIRVIGIPILGNTVKLIGGSETGKQQTGASIKPTVKPAEKSPFLSDSEASAGRKNGSDSGNFQTSSQGVAEKERTENSFAKKIRFTFNNICDKLNKAGEFKSLFLKIKPDLMKLLKIILPKQINGYIEFGFEDPALTGFLVAFLSVLCLSVPSSLKLDPSFKEEKFESDVRLSGKFALFGVLLRVVSLFRRREFRRLLREFSSGKKNKISGSPNRKNKNSGGR